MTFTQKILLALAAMLVPLSAVAAVPPTITSVETKLTNGVLTVRWDPPRDSTDIAFYRVYFSHESILARDGNYDDFERTKGPETMVTFTKLPLQSKKIFAAVLAVNAVGQESEGFETEASVDVPENAAGAFGEPSSSASSDAVSGQTVPETYAEPAFVPYVRNPMLEQVTDEDVPELSITGESAALAPRPSGRKDLPDSGLGLLGIVAISGLIAGRCFLRTKRREVMVD